MAKNRKLDDAIWALGLIGLGSGNFRLSVERRIRDGYISPDDPWVSAALGCVNDADIPDIALEFFLADVKSGYYDMPPKEGLYDSNPIEPPSVSA